MRINVLHKNELLVAAAHPAPQAPRLLPIVLVEGFAIAMHYGGASGWPDFCAALLGHAALLYGAFGFVCMFWQHGQNEGWLGGRLRTRRWWARDAEARLALSSLRSTIDKTALTHYEVFFTMEE
jgi:hypothetical protein